MKKNYFQVANNSKGQKPHLLRKRSFSGNLLIGYEKLFLLLLILNEKFFLLL